jgi:hypothetical protein
LELEARLELIKPACSGIVSWAPVPRFMTEHLRVLPG